jgi:hypothetical protein
MKVVCIKKYLSTSLQYELTYGKIYETLPKSSNDPLVDDYRIECDRGFIEYYSKSTFVTLEDWRQQQLDKLL